MAKIKLTESQLREIVAETVKRVLSEDNGPYSSGNINTSVYGYGDGGRYQNSINAARANRDAWNKSATERNQRERYAQQNQEMERQQFSNDMDVVNSLKGKVLNFYRTLKQYEEKGLLRKLFSSKPNMSDFGVKPTELNKLRYIYKYDTQAISKVSTTVKTALEYFARLGIISLK